MPIPFRTAILISFLAISACDSAEERAEKHFQSGMELLEAGDAIRALVEFRNVFSLDGNHIPARMAYARAARDLGKFRDSYANFLRVAETEPENKEALLALTEMAVIGQQWDEAERHGAALRKIQTPGDGSEVPLLALRFREATLSQDAPAKREITREAGGHAGRHSGQ